MAEKVVMPKLGATMEEGIIDSWLVDIGEEIEEGDPIVEIQTDKITIEVEAEAAGVLLKKLYDVGDTVPVQKVIAYIGEAGEEIGHVEEDDSVGVVRGDFMTPNEQTNEVAAHTDGQVATDRDRIQIRRTPFARRLAEENNVNLAEITGTGPLGRIQKIDVENYLAQPTQKITPLAKKVVEDKQLDITQLSGSGAHGKIVKDDVIAAQSRKQDVIVDDRVALKGMRKVIANRISESFYTAPHVTLFSEIDMTEVVSLRKQLLPVIEEMEGVRVSFNDIILKATAFSLKRNPNINISLEEEEIIYYKNIHLGVAVAVPNGLVVPVITNVDQKGLGAIATEAKTIARQARDGLLPPEKMQGSTFTISNLGMFAIDGFTPIINQPNAAILGVGRIQEKPVVVDGEIKVRSMMELSLSFDHRIIDGAPAAQFLTDLKDILEQPYKLMV